VFKRISKRLKGKPKKSSAAAQAEPDTSSSSPLAPAPKPDTPAKPDIWSWGLLTGTYNPLPDDADADEDSADDTKPLHHGDNKS